MRSGEFEVKLNAELRLIGKEDEDFVVYPIHTF